jgi:hypothetical protein
MKRIFVAGAMAGSLAIAGCGRGELTATSPTTPSAGTFAVASGPSIGGMVQSIEKPTRGLIGARIDITSGANAGKFAVSDDTGSFGLLGLAAGPTRLHVSKTGYEAWSSKDFDLQADTKLAIELFPTPPANSSGARATGRCNDGSWTWSASRADACVNNGGMAYGVCPGPLCKSGV